MQLKKEVLQVVDHFKSNKVFKLKWNEAYACYETFPKPSEKEIGSYYESQSYISHQKGYTSLKDLAYKWVRNYMLKTKINWVKKEANEVSSVLDIGCGIGEFIHQIHKTGVQAVGVEPNDKARTIAKKKNLDIYKDLNEIDKARKFDVITLWHVLEHLYEPNKFLQNIQERLNPDGHLFIAVPNFKSHDAKHYREYWAAYDVPRHLYHFSKESIELLAQKNNMQLKRTYPLKFDSYYVSLLSEKYMPNKTSFGWIWQGYISNRKAKKNGEWSSLVFVLQKQQRSRISQFEPTSG